MWDAYRFVHDYFVTFPPFRAVSYSIIVAFM